MLLFLPRKFGKWSSLTHFQMYLTFMAQVFSFSAIRETKIKETLVFQIPPQVRCGLLGMFLGSEYLQKQGVWKPRENTSPLKVHVSFTSRPNNWPFLLFPFKHWSSAFFQPLDSHGPQRTMVHSRPGSMTLELSKNWKRYLGRILAVQHTRVCLYGDFILPSTVDHH